MNLLQREVAEIIGVNEATIQHWETGAHSVALAPWPAVLEFLGYDPRTPGQTIGEKLRLRREALGLPRAELARQWGVDPATVTKYELKDDARHNHLSIPNIMRFLGYNPLPPPQSPGQYIRYTRYAAGLKQTEFAVRLRVSNATVSAWELDQKTPSLAQLAPIELISMTLEAPFRIPCPDHLRAECTATVRTTQRTRPRSTYPSKLEALGDHIRKRRIDLRLSQAALAHRFGVNRNAITNWEAGSQKPDLTRMPQVIEFLGHDPMPQDEPLGERIRVKRRALGLTQVEFGRLFGVSRETLNMWETGKRTPGGAYLDRVRKVLGE